MTFQMDGQAMKRQMEQMKSRPAGPQRAADVAQGFKPSARPSGAGRKRGSLIGRFFKLVGVLALLGVVALGVAAVLQTFGVINIDLNF
jgi:hypothetical protein